MSEKPQVLVVDDELVVCKSVERILSKEGFQVDYALDALEALKRLQAKPYSVVVTDLMMPKMSGMELLERIGRDFPKVQVIMITGYATIKTAVQAIKLGAFDYIPKPFTPDELSSAVVRAIERIKLYDLVKPEAEVIEEITPPPAEITAEYYVMPEHSWAKVEPDGTVRIGIDDIYQKTVGTIVNIDLPYENDEVEQGKVCARITGKDMRLFTLWCPVSGKIVRINEEVLSNCSLANKDPYGKGWLMLIKPFSLAEDLQNLIPGKK